MYFKYLLIIALQLFYLNSLSQVDRIIIKYNDEKCFGFKTNYVEDCDSINYYILFESHFEDELVEIKVKDSIIYKGEITTGSLIAKCLNLGNKNGIENFSIKLGSLPVFTLPTFKDMNYVRVGLSRFSKTLVICYAPKLPIFK